MTTVRRWVGSDYFKLLPVLALAFYIGFLPHQSYPYPVHLDEWNNYTYSQAITATQGISFPNPWYGGAALTYPSNEVGFNVFLSVLHMVSGIPLLTIYRFFPAVILMVTALAVYSLARREGFGGEAAFFTCLIPTTVGILGPAFMVPVALGLAFIPLCLLIVFNYRNWWSYPLLYVFVLFLLAVHAPTALGLVIVLVPYLLLNLKADFKRSLGITLALVAPFLSGFPWVVDILKYETAGLFSPSGVTPNVALPHIMGAYGYLPVALGALGIAVLALRGGRKNYGLILGLLLLLLMLVVRFSFHYGNDLMYFRGLLYMMLMMSIIAGAGLMFIRKVRLPERFNIWPKPSPLTRNLGGILCLIVIGLTLYLAIPARQQTPYYHMIDGEDYQAFVWIKENVPGDYQKAILDPWKATAFTAITGKNIFSRITESPQSQDLEALDFLDGGCRDTAFLRDNDISLVYTSVPVVNADLVEVRPYVYLLQEAQTP
jgi:hypothetical protein